MKLLVQGADSAEQVPGLLPLAEDVDLAFAPDGEALARELPGTEILLGWNFRGNELQYHWQAADRLKWIHWCGAGVDAALFEELQSSDVILTNARGIFDRAMAETVLGYMIYEAKDFATTIDHQRSQTWEYRMTHLLRGDRVLVVGVGSIGREIAKVLTALGLSVDGVGRSARWSDPDFDHIFSIAEIIEVLDKYDWVVAIMPSTESTHGLFDSSLFSAMKTSARFVNLGRGTAVVESDLIAALDQGNIAGAMLDVFANEPLAKDDPLWNAKNLFVSPHMSGDYVGFEDDMVMLFKDNLQSYLADIPMQNVIDKKLGFIASGHTP